MAQKSVTAEELVRIPGHCDLVRGMVRTMNPPGPFHGWVSVRIGKLLANWVDARKLGRVYGNDTGFLLARDPDTVLGPDVAFVSSDRIHLEPKRGYFPGPPDLAVEVRSPDDSLRELAAKAEAWLAHGCKMVLTVDPLAETIELHVSGAGPRSFGRGDRVDLGAVVPGFVLAVADVFTR